MDILKQEEYKGHNIKLIQDTSAESPREDDNLGTMVCFHKRYNLSDKHTFENPQVDMFSKREVQEHIKKTDAIWLPVYMYDHGGITINTTGFSCPWDSSQVGVIFIEREKICKEYQVKRISKKLIDKVKELLKGEIKTFNQFLTGEVYGFEIEDPTGTEIDSCWGFYGEEYCLEEARNVIDYYCKPNSVELIKSLAKEQGVL